MFLPPFFVTLLIGLVAAVPHPFTNLPRDLDEAPPVFPDLPAGCDAYNPSDDCIRSLAQGGKIYFDSKGKCTSDKKDKVQTAALHAKTLAEYSRSFPVTDGGNNAHGMRCGNDYMGPDWDEFTNRIAGNLDRAYKYQTDKTPEGDYMTIGCADMHDRTLCRDTPGVGGYAWTYKGWFGYKYTYIVFCDRFFGMDSLSTKMRMIQDELNRGDTRKARDMNWLASTGQLFLHEFMHTQYANDNEPHITDELINPAADPKRAVKAYGPDRVYTLAQRAISRGGGARRASTNADSYAMLANCMWWWAQTDQYPGVPGRTAGMENEDSNADNAPVIMLHVDLGEERIESVNLDALFDAELAGYGGPDPEDETQILAGKKLRVLPLGDSITQGFPSADGNGYRKELYDLLVGAGATVDMIGSGTGGNMEDPDEEGHNALHIAEIASLADRTLDQRPNVVLLHAGTNDMKSDEQAAGAPGRLASLIDRIFEKCPDATVFAALIIPSKIPDFQRRIDSFNREVQQIIEARSAQGKHIILVNMNAALSTADLVDDLHPTDEGYRRMGGSWYNGMATASARGWIGDPVPSNPRPGKNFCPHNPIWLPNGEIATGGGLGPNFGMARSCVNAPRDSQGALQCACSSQGLTTVVNPPPSGRCGELNSVGPPAVHFADLNGDGRAEYLWVAPTGAVTAFHNSGGPGGGEAAKVNWIPMGTIATGAGASRGQIRFADLNGDGRAEFLIVRSRGNVEAYVNLGAPGMNGWLPNGEIASGHPGADGEGVRFADIDGDGRADYLWLDAKGAVVAYINAGPALDNGPNAAKVIWFPAGEIAAGVGGVRSDIVFADINGDGRDDYLWIDRSNGAIQAWLNLPGADRFKVNWRPLGQIASGPGDGSNGSGIQLADLNGDGRAEYLNVNAITSAVNAYVNGC